MKVVFCTLFALLFAQAVKSQEILFNKDIRMAGGWVDRREAYPVNSVSGKQFSLFLIDNKSIKALLLDEGMNLTDSVNGERPEGKYGELLGSSQSNGRYNLYFSNKAHDKLAVARCDYAAKTIDQFEIEMPFDKQKYAGSVSFNGKFYILTVVKNTSQLNVYAFDDATHYGQRTSEFKNEPFVNNEAYYTLYAAVAQNPFVSLDNEVPNPIDLVRKKNKLYTFDNKIVLTLDNQNKRTQVITIDVNTLEASLKKYAQRPVDCVGANSNSYIYKNTLYQMRICQEAMMFSMLDLGTGQFHNEFKAARDEDMTFKNGAVIQKGGTYDKERELSRTRQFLRKVTMSEPGVSVYQVGAVLEVTLGCYAEITATGGSAGGGMISPGMSGTIPGGGTYTMAPTYNPTHYGYYSYKSSKSVILTSLLEPTTFQHRPGEPAPNAFDKIQELTKDKGQDMVAETTFKRDEFLLFGFYSRRNRKYEIRGYKD